MAQIDLERGLHILEARARIVTVLLRAYIGTSALFCLTLLGCLVAGIDLNDVEHPATLLNGLSGLLLILVFIVSAVTVSLWIYRAHANLRSAGFEGLAYSPGWAVGWFLVPFALLFKPLGAMRELWDTSHLQTSDQAAHTDSSLTLWWTLWLIGSIGLNLSTRFSGIMSAFNLFDGLSYAALAGSAWFLMRIVAKITRAQTSDMAAVYAFA